MVAHARTGWFLFAGGEPPDQGRCDETGGEFWPGMALVVKVVVVVNARVAFGDEEAKERDEGDEAAAATVDNHSNDSNIARCAVATTRRRRGRRIGTRKVRGKNGN